MTPMMFSADLGDGGYNEALEKWAEIQQRFLVAHEYSHLILNHLGPDRVARVTVNGEPFVLPGGETLGCATRSQIEELLADHQGAAMTINSVLADETLSDFGRELCI